MPLGVEALGVEISHVLFSTIFPSYKPVDANLIWQVLCGGDHH